MSKKNYMRKAVWGAVYSAIFLGLTSVAALLIRMVLARGLSVEDFGLFYSVLAFVGMFSFLRDLGLSEAQVRFIPRFTHQEKKGKIKGIILLVLTVQALLGTLFFLLFVISGRALSSNYFKSPFAYGLLVILGLWFLIDGIMESLALAFNAQQKIRLQTSSFFVHLLGALIITLILLQKDYGIYAPALGYLFGAIIVIVPYGKILFSSTLPQFRSISLEISWEDVREYLKYSLPLVPASAGYDLLFYRITIVLLTAFASLTQVALYSAAYATARILKHIYRPIRDIVFPLSSELWEKDRKKHLSEGVELLYKFSFLLAMPLTGILLGFPEELLRVLFGESFTGAVGMLRILALALFLLIFTKIAESVLLGIGRSSLATIQIYVGGITNVLAALILIPPYGMYGAAIAFLIGNVVMMLFAVGKLRNLAKANIPWKIWSLITLASLIFLTTILGLKRLLSLWFGFEIVICLLVAGLIYVGLVFLLRVITKDEIISLIQRTF